MKQMDMGIADVLAQMRAIKAKVQNMPGGNESVQASSQAVDFAQLLKNQIDEVNRAMKTSGELADKFVQGVPGISEVEVMIALQKSSVAYTALSQVRNKMLSAYQEIMSMTV